MLGEMPHFSCWVYSIVYISYLECGSLCSSLLEVGKSGRKREGMGFI